MGQQKKKPEPKKEEPRKEPPKPKKKPKKTPYEKATQCFREAGASAHLPADGRRAETKMRVFAHPDKDTCANAIGDQAKCDALSLCVGEAYNKKRTKGS